MSYFGLSHQIDEVQCQLTDELKQFQELQSSSSASEAALINALQRIVGVANRYLWLLQQRKDNKSFAVDYPSSEDELPYR